jgi:hypothetical protein
LCSYIVSNDIPSCFPHIINISVQHILDKITNAKGAKDSSASFVPQPTPNASGAQTDDKVIKRDPISLARASVRFVRASNACRVGFENIIKQGNNDSDFVTAEDPNYQIRNVQLLRDMEVWWDSTYYMIRRVLEMRPVCQILT